MIKYKACGILALWVATAMALPAQTFTPMQNFDGADGQGPWAALIQATDGNYYGTTYFGGSTGNGTVFKIAPGGAFTTIYTFCEKPTKSGECPDGGYPAGALVQAANGDFYGTTTQGGRNGGPGTAFVMTPSGDLTTLYTFCKQSGCPDGEEPFGLVQAINGDLYGTTTYGGAHAGGTIFEITPSGGLTTLYNFCALSGCADGDHPSGPLIQASDGNIYGPTEQGGINGCPPNPGCGTLFKMTPSGTLTTLYSFCAEAGCPDGFGPSGLIQATNGEFYGTTIFGGAGTWGTVFEIAKSGKLTTLHSFCTQTDCTDGETGLGVVQGSDGNFYGMTQAGEQEGGAIFEMDSRGGLTTLYTFCPTYQCQTGGLPIAGLLQGTDGSFYGTTYSGGTHQCFAGEEGCGTVFSLSEGLGPFVKTQTTLGPVGSVVKILGTNLTGATSVSFNGTSAAFTVSSASLITATVPAGATSGVVEVVTPSGTLSSIAPFHVRQ